MDGAVEPGPRLETAARQVVRRREAECLGQLPGPAPAGAEAEQGGHHLGRRARRPAGAHVLGPGPGGGPVRQRTQAPGSAAGAIGWRSICRWCPRRRSPCWPAPGSARCTRSCSADSRRRRSATGSTTPGRSRSSPPTAAIAAARSSRSSGWPTRRWPKRPRSSTASWSAAAPEGRATRRSRR